VKSVSRPLGSCLPTLESLESRRLLSVSLTALPNLVLPQGSPPQGVDLSQVFRDNTTGVSDLSFSTKSDNTALVQATITGSNLALSLAPTVSGFAHVVIQALAPDGSTASQLLRIHVTPSADRTLSVPLGIPGHGTFRFVQANHTIGQITLIGPGSGTITLGGDGLSLAGNQARGANQELESIDLTGTTGATRLIVSGVAASRGRYYSQIGDITSDGSLGAIVLRKVDLVGDVTLQGGVSLINIALAQSSSLSFGQSIGPVGLRVGYFSDVNLSTPAPFGLVQGTDWVNTDSIPESFKAASIARIYMPGNFDVGVQLTGASAGARTIGKITVGGAIGGTWSIPGNCAPLLIGGTTADWNATFDYLPSFNDVGSMGGSLTVPSLSYLRVHGNMLGAIVNLTGTGATDLGSMHVFGVMRGSAVQSAGNLGSIIASAMQGSVIYAGIAPLPQGQSLPATAADLAASATIGSISLRPRGRVKIGLQVSDIAAANIGFLSLATTQVANNGVPFGIAAESIGRLLVRDLTNRRPLFFTNIHDTATLAAQIAAQNLNLEDFTITVLS
jgi:hypothetical protein